MPFRYRFGSKARNSLWFGGRMRAHLAGRGVNPIRPHCDQPVLPTDAWDRCHVGAPTWAGGNDTQVGYRAVQSAAQRRRRHAGFLEVVPRAQASRRRAWPRPRQTPVAGRPTITKTFRHGVQRRLSGAEKHALMMATRVISYELDPPRV